MLRTPIVSDFDFAPLIKLTHLPCLDWIKSVFVSDDFYFSVFTDLEESKNNFSRYVKSRYFIILLLLLVSGNIHHILALWVRMNFPHQMISRLDQVLDSCISTAEAWSLKWT